jgi:hypothetical protein
LTGEESGLDPLILLAFIEEWESGNRDSTVALDPCLTVGDLLIALESAGVPCMFTMNSKESQHLCRALGQSLVVRKPNPKHEDIYCSADDEEWPAF